VEGCVNLDSKQPKREEVGSSMILEKAAILEVKASSHVDERVAPVLSGLPE
jgi:hypothetical protein